MLSGEGRGGDGQGPGSHLEKLGLHSTAPCYHPVIRERGNSEGGGGSPRNFPKQAASSGWKISTTGVGPKGGSLGTFAGNMVRA